MSEIIFTGISEPSAPSAGKFTIYVDSTSGSICLKTEAGTVYTLDMTVV